MSRRKNGETHKQYIKRLEANLANSESNNRALRQHLFNVCNEGDVMNPKTNRLYREEAQELYNTVALVEMFIRNEEAANAVGMLYGQLHALGFSDFEIMTNEALKDGAYNVRNKVEK